MFLAIAAYNLLKVFNTAAESVRIKPKQEAIVKKDDKKERILAKEHLRSRGEHIIEKYMKATS